MPRRPVLALALLSALTGCFAAPPKGALVEYRSELTPITRPVRCPAIYVLRAEDQPGAPPLAEHRAAEGERLGFRREEDGSVAAVGPGYTLPLAPGRYRWEVVRASVTPWGERVRERIRDDAVTTAKATRDALLITGIVVLAVALVVAYGIGQSNSGIR